MGKSQPTYTKEFKQQAVHLFETSGKSKTQISRDLGISDSALSKWCKEFGEQGEEAFPGKGHQIAIEEETRKLKRENEILRQERDILKKAVLEVSENGYNNWRRRGKSKRKRDDEQLAERIEDAYQKHRGRYGSPRIHAELQAQGLHCGRKRVARLMRENNLYAGKKRRKARTTNSHHRFPIASNHLKRDFEASAPNKKWVADITFIETREGWLYLSGVLDTYSRKIVGWAMDKCHDAELVKTALQMALLRRQPAAGLIHHSDRGSEYASTSYQLLLQEQNIQASMSNIGDCYDNAMMESFWATLKEECCGPTIFASRNEAKVAIFEYIEVYYNRQRIHSSLGYFSPVNYEIKEEQRKEVLS